MTSEATNSISKSSFRLKIASLDNVFDHCRITDTNQNYNPAAATYSTAPLIDSPPNRGKHQDFFWRGINPGQSEPTDLVTIEITVDNDISEQGIESILEVTALLLGCPYGLRLPFAPPHPMRTVGAMWMAQLVSLIEFTTPSLRRNRTVTSSRLDFLSPSRALEVIAPHQSKLGTEFLNVDLGLRQIWLVHVGQHGVQNFHERRHCRNHHQIYQSNACTSIYQMEAPSARDPKLTTIDSFRKAPLPGSYTVEPQALWPEIQNPKEIARKYAKLCKILCPSVQYVQIHPWAWQVSVKYEKTFSQSEKHAEIEMHELGNDEIRAIELFSYGHNETQSGLLCEDPDNLTWYLAALCPLKPRKISNTSSYWLRDVIELVEEICAGSKNGENGVKADASPTRAPSYLYIA
ncbi:hypothetical protein G7Y89_g10000 [Cudoniella acicularis]|uniref:Uncharacterized protein n=1 Tax=Cudoniella acicularis TaxID=354080 RepID=A0A8H4RFW2_9HELO|nr:hypothetical protein G7Y89_g10000 [Cudoniella acicularis]